MPKNKRGTLLRKADKLFQKKFVSENPHCILCGKPTASGHHYIPKSLSSRLRYDIRNMVALCVGCHLRHHKQGDPEIKDGIDKIKGRKWKKTLDLDRRIPTKLNITELKEIIKEYEI